MRNIFLILSFVCLSFLAKGQDTLLGPHGGIIVPGGKYHVEVFRCGEYYEIFLLTKELKSVSNYSIEGDLKYFYPDGTFISTELGYYENDGFTSRVPNADFVYCRLSLDVLGEFLTLKFDNESYSLSKGSK